MFNNKDFDNTLLRLALGLLLLGVALGLLIVDGIPEIWSILKPYLHALTA